MSLSRGERGQYGSHALTRAGMLVHWATEYTEKLLPDHLLARIKEFRVDANVDSGFPIPHFKASTGEIMHRIEAPNIVRWSRKKIRRLLTEDGSVQIKVSGIIDS